jgi:Raf kinase inhibitor-like YbhB/YbcL family protein
LGSRDRSSVRLAGLSAMVLLSALTAGCGLVGGPQALRQDAPQVMTVTSTVIERGTIPRRYTCRGTSRRPQSPPISWSGAPPGTRSIALVIDDADAPITPYVYWIVFDIDPATTDIPAGLLPEGARQAQNSLGRASYDPPCPRGGNHKYRFTVYALNSPLTQGNGAPLKSTWTAIARHAIARGRLTGIADP